MMHNTGHVLFISKYYSSLGQCYFSHLFLCWRACEIPQAFRTARKTVQEAAAVNKRPQVWHERSGMSRQVKTRRKRRAARGQVPFDSNDVMDGVPEAVHAGAVAGITTDRYLVFFFPLLLLLFIYFPNSFLSRGSCKLSARGGGK